MQSADGELQAAESQLDAGGAQNCGWWMSGCRSSPMGSGMGKTRAVMCMPEVQKGRCAGWIHVCVSAEKYI